MKETTTTNQTRPSEWFRNQLEELHDLALLPDFRSDIHISQIKEAKKMVYRKAKTRQDLLEIFSAINLLNAAIKRKEYKKQLSYGPIKGNVSRLLADVMQQKDTLGIDFWLNPAEDHCAYVEVEGLQFSFHRVPMTEEMRAFTESEENIIRPWRGLRLQKIAAELFEVIQFKRGIE